MCLSSARTWRVPTILRAMRRSSNSILSKPASRGLIFQPALVTRPVFSRLACESHADWNRPGYMLYGNSPMTTDVESAHALQPAMTLRSEIIAIREVPAGESVGYGACWTAKRPSVVGAVAAGYADGYPRHAPNGTPTMVNGQIAPLVGTVSMDMLSIDLTDHDNIGHRRYSRTLGARRTPSTKSQPIAEQ